MTSLSRTPRRTAQAERSRQTRSRIATAATALFLRDGFLQTTMSAIAKEAGVAYQTLYISFGSKVALLAAAFDIAVAGDDEPIPVLDRGWHQILREEPDGPRALRVFIDVARQIIERHKAFWPGLSLATPNSWMNRRAGPKTPLWSIT